MKKFAKNYLKAIVFILFAGLAAAAFVGLVVLPTWLYDTVGHVYGLVLFGVYVLLVIGLIAAMMEE